MILKEFNENPSDPDFKRQTLFPRTIGFGKLSDLSTRLWGDEDYMVSESMGNIRVVTVKYMRKSAKATI